MLDDAGSEACRPSAALDAFVPLASSCAQATEVVAVAGAPAPAADVHGIGVAQVFAAGGAQPDDIVAIARNAFKRRGCECARLVSGRVAVAVKGEEGRARTRGAWRRGGGRQAALLGGRHEEREGRLCACAAQSPVAGSQGGCGRGLHGAVLAGSALASSDGASRHQTYPAHDIGTPRAFANHVPRTFAHAAARQTRAVMAAVFVAAVERVLLHLVAVLEQVGAELPAGARQVVQRVEVQLAGELSDNAAAGAWLACIRAWSYVLCLAVAAHG